MWGRKRDSFWDPFLLPKALPEGSQNGTPGDALAARWRFQDRLTCHLERLNAFMKKRVSLQSGRGFAVLTVPCAILVAHKVEHIFTKHCFCRVSKTTPKNDPKMTRSCAKKGSQNGAPWAGLAAKMKLPLGKNSTYLQKPCSRCSPARFLHFVAPIFRKGLKQEPQDASGWTSRDPRVSLSSPWAGLAAKMKVPLGKNSTCL